MIYYCGLLFQPDPIYQVVYLADVQMLIIFALAIMGAAVLLIYAQSLKLMNTTSNTTRAHARTVHVMNDSVEITMDQLEKALEREKKLHNVILVKQSEIMQLQAIVERFESREIS